jgi:hypothetical protein
VPPFVMLPGPKMADIGGNFRFLPEFIPCLGSGAVSLKPSSRVGSFTDPPVYGPVL